MIARFFRQNLLFHPPCARLPAKEGARSGADCLSKIPDVKVLSELASLVDFMSHEWFLPNGCFLAVFVRRGYGGTGSHQRGRRHVLIGRITRMVAVRVIPRSSGGFERTKSVVDFVASIVIAAVHIIPVTFAMMMMMIPFLVSVESVSNAVDARAGNDRIVGDDFRFVRHFRCRVIRRRT